ncbi:hypothetical protein E3N88_17009 [Mikania micrantha]|uniref:RRM domain-containing protein n=1 Tax=Mikania micrantha TaxID=192012 RepID=A0A5N6NSF2_9ASTR|nr:hypothetical protein E3N88_17009 [Mikania micrantha]
MPFKRIFMLGSLHHVMPSITYPKGFMFYPAMSSISEYMLSIWRNFAFVQFETQEEATKALECTHMSKILDRVVSVEYALRDDSERGNRSMSPRRDYGRRGDSPYRSPSPYRRGRPSPDYGRARSPVYDRYTGPSYERPKSPVYGRYRR